MTHAFKTTLERMAARRNGAAWRRHVLKEVAEQRDQQANPLWSRAWLSRHARRPEAR